MRLRLISALVVAILLIISNALLSSFELVKTSSNDGDVVGDDWKNSVAAMLNSLGVDAQL